MDGGARSFESPDYLGVSLEDAKVVIFGSNLNLGNVKIVGDTVGGDAVVLKQKPAPKENVTVGDVVDLWIGKPGTLVPEEEDELEDVDNR
jgi:beta-lactam-binding protein with PASTA domain